MNLPEPHRASKEEITHTLNHLCRLLINLPKGLPTGSKYQIIQPRSWPTWQDQRWSSYNGWTAWICIWIVNTNHWGWYSEIFQARHRDTGHPAYSCRVLCKISGECCPKEVDYWCDMQSREGLYKPWIRCKLQHICNTYHAKWLTNLLKWTLYRSQTSLSKL